MQTHFAAKLEVNHYNGNLRAANDKNDEDEEKKSEQVVVLVLPDRLKPYISFHKQRQVQCSRRENTIPWRWRKAQWTSLQTAEFPPLMFYEKKQHVLLPELILQNNDIV